MSADNARDPNPDAPSDFATTHWTIVLQAREPAVPEASAALSQLCEAYWHPLYAYIRRRMADVHEAQDFTQAFFAQLLEKDFVANADPERGRFRAYLLTACKRFLINEWEKARTAKRGGGRRPLSLDFDSSESKLGLVPVETQTAEQLYERQWAITLLERVMEQLRSEYSAKNRMPHFETLKTFLAGSSQGTSYAEAARTLGISESNAKVAAHRMRQRYRELLRAEIAQTVQGSDEIDAEIRDLFAVLGRM